MDKNKTCIIALILALIALGASIIIKQAPCEQQEKITCPPCICNQSTELKLIYLMPPNCLNCDIQEIDKISNQLNITIEKYVSDSVPQPSILIFTGQKNTLATADRRYNILNSICQFTQYQKACELRDSLNLTGVHQCLLKYNITPNTTILLHNSENTLSAKIREWIREKENHVKVISINNIELMKQARECLNPLTSFDNLLIPQLICPATGERKISSLTKEEVNKFIEACYST